MDGLGNTFSVKPIKMQENAMILFFLAILLVVFAILIHDSAPTTSQKLILAWLDRWDSHESNDSKISTRGVDGTKLLVVALDTIECTRLLILRVSSVAKIRAETRFG